MVQSKNYRIWIRIAVIGILLALMAFCVPSGSVVAEEYASLPMEDVGGPEPDSDCYTDTTYTDPSLSVEIFYDTNGETAYIYAHVRIIDPTQIRSASAANFNYMYTMPAVSIAQRVNAVLAINGDYYNHQQRVGYIVRQGKRYRNSPTGQDLLLIDSEGNFRVLYGPDSREIMEAYLAGLPDGIEIWQTFSFGPVLIDGGEVVYTENDEYFEISTDKKTQRVGIGQLGPLEYYIVSTEGPEDDPDSGFTVADFALLMDEIGSKLSDTGATVAYNLDGGSSNTLVFNNQKINSTDRDKVRSVGDIIYFSTLVDSGN